MSNGSRNRPVKLPSFKITSKKRLHKGPVGGDDSGHATSLAGHFSGKMTIGQQLPTTEVINRDRKDKSQVSHLSRSRSFRETSQNKGEMPGMREFEVLSKPSCDEKVTRSSRSATPYTSDALVTWLESHQQSFSEAMKKLGADPSSKADVSEKYVSSLLRKMKLLDTKKEAIVVDNVESKTPVANEAESQNTSHNKQRAKSEPATSRNKRKGLDRLSESNHKSRSQKSPRLSSEYRRQEPSMLLPSDDASLQPLSVTVDLILPKRPGEPGTADKLDPACNGKSPEPRKRKNKTKKSRGKTRQLQQLVEEEQSEQHKVDFNNKDNQNNDKKDNYKGNHDGHNKDKHEENETTRNSLQENKSGFRFGSKKRKPCFRDAGVTSRQAADGFSGEDRTPTNNESGDDEPSHKQHKQSNDRDVSMCGKHCRNSRDPDPSTGVRSPSITETSVSGSVDKFRRRKSSNLCLRKRQEVAPRELPTGGGNFFRNFADAVGSQLNSIAYGSQRLYHFPGMQRLYTPDVDLNSMYSPYSRDEECEEDEEQLDSAEPPAKGISSTSIEEPPILAETARSDTSRKRPSKSPSPVPERETDHESSSDSRADDFSKSDKDDLVSEGNVSISSGESSGRIDRRESVKSGRETSEIQKRQISSTSGVRESPKSDKRSRRSTLEGNASVKSVKSPRSVSLRSKRSSSASKGQRSPSSTAKGQRSPSSAAKGQRSPSSATMGQRSPSSAAKGQRSPSGGSKSQRSPPGGSKSQRSPSGSSKRGLGKRGSGASSLREDSGKTSRVSDRGTPPLTKSSGESVTSGQRKKTKTPSKESPRNLPESGTAYSLESSRRSTKSTRKHTPDKDTKMASPRTQGRISRDVSDSENGKAAVEADKSVTSDGKKDSSQSSGKSRVEYLPKKSAMKKGSSSESSVTSSLSPGSSGTSSIRSGYSGSKKPSDRLLGDVQVGTRETPAGIPEADAPGVTSILEEEGSSAKSSRAPSERVHSFAPSERQKVKESMQSLAASRSKSSSRPKSGQVSGSKSPLDKSDRKQGVESARSLARSDRMQPPESAHSLAKSDGQQSSGRLHRETIQSPASANVRTTSESIQSKGREPIEYTPTPIGTLQDKTPPYDSRISVEVVDTVSKVSKTSQKSPHWTPGGKQLVAEADESCIIDTTQMTIVIESEPASESSSSKGRGDLKQSTEMIQDWDPMGSQTEAERRQLKTLPDSAQGQVSIYSVNVAETYHKGSVPSERPHPQGSAQSVTTPRRPYLSDSKDYYETTEGLQSPSFGPPIAELESKQGSFSDKDGSPPKGELSPQRDGEESETLIRSPDRDSKRLADSGERSPQGSSLVPSATRERLQEKLSSGLSGLPSDKFRNDEAVSSRVSDLGSRRSTEMPVIKSSGRDSKQPAISGERSPQGSSLVPSTTRETLQERPSSGQTGIATEESKDQFVDGIRTPSKEGSKYPSLDRIRTPSIEGSKYPSVDRTRTPSKEGSKYPSVGRTLTPSIEGSKYPSVDRTRTPSKEGSKYPSEGRTLTPSKEGSKYPSVDRTRTPSKEGSAYPSVARTLTPSKEGSKYPSVDRTRTPSKEGSKYPSVDRTGTQSKEGSTYLSVDRTLTPSKEGSKYPSVDRTGTQSREGSKYPSVDRTRTPSKEGSKYPSVDRESDAMLSRLTDTGSKGSAQKIYDIETVVTSALKVLQESMPRGDSKTASDSLQQSVQDSRESPLQDRAKSSYMHTEEEEEVEKLLSGSRIFGSGRLSLGSQGFGSKIMIGGERMSESRRSVPMSDKYRMFERTHSLSTIDREQTADRKPLGSTSELQTGKSGRSSADTSQIMKTSVKDDKRQKSTDAQILKRLSTSLADKRLTPSKVEEIGSLGDQKRDYKHGMRTDRWELDACRRVLLDRRDIGHGDDRKVRARDHRGCCCTKGDVHMVTIVMKKDSPRDGQASCSSIQVSSSIRSPESCQMLKATDCTSLDNTESPVYEQVEGKSYGRSWFVDREDKLRQSSRPRRPQPDGVTREKSFGLSRADARFRCPCESILRRYATEVSKSLPPERQLQRQWRYETSPTDRYRPPYDTSPIEKSLSSRYSSSRSATNQPSRPTETYSRSLSQPRLREDETGSERSWRHGDPLAREADNDDVPMTLSEIQGRYEMNDDLGTSSPRDAVEETTDFETSQNIYSRRPTRNGRMTATRTSANQTKGSSPRAKPSKEDALVLTTGHGRTIDRYEKKCGDSHITVTSTSSKSDCSNLRITVKSCQDRKRKFHTRPTSSKPDEVSDDFETPTQQGLAHRYSSDSEHEAKTDAYPDYDRSYRRSDYINTSETSQEGRRDKGKSLTDPESESSSRHISKEYQSTGLNQHRDTARDSRLATGHSDAKTGHFTSRPDSGLLSRHGVRFPYRSDETSSDTTSLPAIRDTTVGSRYGRDYECESYRKRQSCTANEFKYDARGDSSPVKKDYDSCGDDNKRIRANLHLTSRPASRAKRAHPRIEVKISSSRSSQDSLPVERQIRANIQRRSQKGQSSESRSPASTDRQYTCSSSGSARSARPHHKSPEATSISADDLEDEYTNTETIRDQLDSRRRPSHRRQQQQRLNSDVKKMHGRITFRCSDCSSGRPHICKCQDAQVAIQKGEVRVVATSSGGRMIGCQRSEENMSSGKSLVYTTPPDSANCLLRHRKCLENFLSDSCMDRYEPEYFGYRAKYGLTSGRYNSPKTPIHRPFSRGLDVLNRRSGSQRSRSSYHILSSRCSPQPPRLHYRPQKGSRPGHEIPRNVVSVDCHSRSNSASPTLTTLAESPGIVDTFEQIITPDLKFPSQDAQQVRMRQKVVQVRICFQKSHENARFKIDSSRTTGSMRSQNEFVGTPQVYHRGKQSVSKNKNYISTVNIQPLMGQTSPCAHPMKIPPPRDEVGDVCTGLSSWPWSTVGSLQASCDHHADEPPLATETGPSHKTRCHGSESTSVDTSRTPSPLRGIHQDLQDSGSSSSSGWADVALWGRNTNFSSSIGGNENTSTGSPNPGVSLEVIDNLNLSDMDRAPSVVDSEINHSSAMLSVPAEMAASTVVRDGCLLETAQSIPPWPPAQVGDQTMAAICLNCQQAVIYARKLLGSQVSASSSGRQEAEVGDSRNGSRSSGASSYDNIYYVFVQSNDCEDNDDSGGDEDGDNDEADGVGDDGNDDNDDDDDEPSGEREPADHLTMQSVSSVILSETAFNQEQTLSLDMHVPPETINSPAEEKEHKSPQHMFKHMTNLEAKANSTGKINQGQINCSSCISRQSENKQKDLNVYHHNARKCGNDVDRWTAGDLHSECCKVILRKVKLSSDEEWQCRKAIGNALNLYRNFTIIPFCYTESTRSPTSLSSDSTNPLSSSTHHQGSNPAQQRAWLGDIDCSKNNPEIVCGQGGVDCDASGAQINIYLITSEKQDITDTHNDISVESTANSAYEPENICNSILGIDSCTVEISGKKYLVFTANELIRVTNRSAGKVGERGGRSEMCQTWQKWKAGLNMKGQETVDQDISISESDFGERDMLKEVTTQKTGQCHCNDVKSNSEDIKDDTRMKSEDGCLDQKLRSAKWRSQAVDSNSFRDHNVSDVGSTGAVANGDMFSGNHCRNVNNSLASPEANSPGQDSSSCHLPPKISNNLEQWRDETRCLTTGERPNSWEATRYPTMTSQHLGTSSCDFRSLHGVFNYGIDLRRPKENHETSEEIVEELSSKPKFQVDWGNPKSVASENNANDDDDCKTADVTERVMSNTATDEVSPRTPKSPGTDTASLNSRENRSREIESENENTCPTFVSLSSEFISSHSKTHKSRGQVDTDPSCQDIKSFDGSLREKPETFSRNPLGILEALVSSKLKVIFDKALERWMSPSHKKCSQITRSSTAKDGKQKMEPEPREGPASPGTSSDSWNRPKEEGQDSSSEVFTTVKESHSEKSITEESFVLLSISAESNVEKESISTARSSYRDKSVTETQETASDLKPQKDMPREKYVLSVKKKRIVPRKRCRKRKERENRGAPSSSASLSSDEPGCPENDIENTKEELGHTSPEQISETRKPEPATDRMSGKQDSPARTRSVTPQRSVQRCGSRRSDVDKEEASKHGHRSVVSECSSHKKHTVSGLRADGGAKSRRRHEVTISRILKHGQPPCDDIDREVTIEITCGKNKEALPSEARTTPKSHSSSGASDVEEASMNFGKSERQSLVDRESRSHARKRGDRSQSDGTRRRKSRETNRDSHEREESTTPDLDMEFCRRMQSRFQEASKERIRSSKNSEKNTSGDEKKNSSSLYDFESVRKSHTLQGQGLRTSAIHNNIRINRKGERLAKGVSLEMAAADAEGPKAAILTPIKEESLSQDSSVADKSKSDSETLSKEFRSSLLDASDAVITHTHESFSKSKSHDSYSRSKNSNDSSHSLSSYHTLSQRSMSARYHHQEEHLADSKRSRRAYHRDRSDPVRRYKDSDCQTDEAAAESSDCYDNFFSYIQSRCPFKSAFLRQEMRGYERWSVPSCSSTFAQKNEDQLLRTYAGGGNCGSNYFRTGKLDLNAFWFRKIRDINMNWVGSDRDRGLTPSQTCLGFLEAPSSAAKETNTRTSGSEYMSCRSSPMETGYSCSDQDQVSMLLGGKLPPRGHGAVCKHGLCWVHREVYPTSTRRLPDNATINCGRPCCHHRVIRDWNTSANSFYHEFLVDKFIRQDQLFVEEFIRQDQLFVEEFIRQDQLFVEKFIRQDQLFVNELTRQDQFFVIKFTREDQFFVDKLTREDQLYVDQFIRQDQFFVDEFIRQVQSVVNEFFRQGTFFVDDLI